MNNSTRNIEVSENTASLAFVTKKDIRYLKFYINLTIHPVENDEVLAA